MSVKIEIIEKIYWVFLELDGFWEEKKYGLIHPYQLSSTPTYKEIIRDFIHEVGGYINFHTY